MTTFDDLRTFVREANHVPNLVALQILMEDMTRELGFEYFALGHHVTVLTGNLVQLGNYPQVWAELIFERNYISEDPILLACQTSAAGFRWSDVSELITLSKRHEEILEGAKRAGLGDGFTVPAHIPGECAGSCSFAREVGKSINEMILPTAQFVGCAGFEAARRLARKHGSHSLNRSLNATHLTTRQLDCVILVARGKSYWEAGKLLGIQPDTVHKHIEAAKSRYGVSTSRQLIVHTLFDNQVAFQDILAH